MAVKKKATPKKVEESKAEEPKAAHVSVPHEIAHVLAYPWKYTIGEIEKAQEALGSLI